MRCVTHVDDHRRGQSVGERYEEERPGRTSAGRLTHPGTHGQVEHSGRLIARREFRFIRAQQPQFYPEPQEG